MQFESRTMPLRTALMTLAVERDARGVLACATIAERVGTLDECAVAVSALTIIGGLAAYELRCRLVTVLGWQQPLQQHDVIRHVAA
jgi:hypothetical protein